LFGIMPMQCISSSWQAMLNIIFTSCASNIY
jgi:hypothetical protein